MKLWLGTIVFFSISFCLNSRATPCTENDTDLQCLICNCYFESRGEPYPGQVMVAKTVLSRVASPQFPNSICAVVYQNRQFSWTEDRVPNRMQTSSRSCERAAREAVQAGPNGVLWFHTPAVIPAWSRSRKVKRCGQLGLHLFYVAARSDCPPEFEEPSSPRTPDVNSNPRQGVN